MQGVLRERPFERRGARALRATVRAARRMNTASKAISLHGLKRRALSLGGSKAFDQAMQFLLPIVLARCLDAATFGEYRLLWLVIGTVLAIGTLNMGVSLYYFLPRAAAPLKKVYVHNTLVYFACAALLL